MEEIKFFIWQNITKMYRWRIDRKGRKEGRKEQTNTGKGYNVSHVQTTW